MRTVSFQLFRYFINFFKRANGKTLFVSFISENAEQAKQMKAGAVITVKHSGMNVHGTLQYPQFYRERLDVKWDDVNKSL